MSKDYLNQKHFLTAAREFALLVHQLRNVTQFLSSAVAEMDAAKTPYTARSYLDISRAVAINLDALENVQRLLPDVGSKTLSVSTRLTNVSEVVGTIDYAVLRVGVILKPMELHKLPDGTPGSKSFEEAYKPRTELYRASEVLVHTLQETAAFLKSPVHDLSLAEDVRAARYTEARKKWLTREIAEHAKNIREAEEFLASARGVHSRLMQELSVVDTNHLPGLGAPIVVTEEPTLSNFGMTSSDADTGTTE